MDVGDLNGGGMNQNLLIVDDEREILSWLEELFRYEFDGELGVYTAGSALDAVKLLARVRFDVVLTDIRMPGMDGITLFRHIKDNWPRCKTVFLTGYGNFEDIYQIIKHNDVKYVLKSENDDVIIEAVRQFLNQSRMELEAEQNRKEQESRLEEARYWLRRELMNQLCSGEKIPQNLSERMKTVEIPFTCDKPVLAFLLRLEQDWKDAGEVQTRLLREAALIQFLQNNMPPKLNFYVHNLENNQGLLLVQPCNGEKDWQLISVIVQGAIEYVQEQFRNLYHDTLSAVAAQEPVMLTELAACLRQLKKYMVGYIGGAREIILRAEALEPQLNKPETPCSANWAASLRNLMELRKTGEYFELLGRYLKRMTREASRHDVDLLEIYYSISIFLLQFINENHLNEQMAFRLGLYKLTMAGEHKDWVEAAEYLTEVSKAIFSLLEGNESTLADHALKRVVNYIEEHLEEELSLTTLAEIGGFNASYLSRLFKQVQKETISEFVLHRRMELAKSLLADSNVKIQDIAMKTGYLSPHSFTRAFRNECGISPTEYRELRLGDKK